MELVPAHVRNLKTSISRKMDDLAGERPESLDAGRLLAGFKEKLIAQTDAKIGTISGNPVLDHLPEACFSKLSGAVAKGAHTWHHKGGAAFRLGWCVDKEASSSRMFDCTLDAAEIAAAVVNEAKDWRRLSTHSTPLVLGMPLTRSSREMAMSSARPSALKIPSAM